MIVTPNSIIVVVKINFDRISWEALITWAKVDFLPFNFIAIIKTTFAIIAAIN